MKWTDPLEKIIPWIPKWGRQVGAVFLLLFALYALRLVLKAVF